MKYKINLMAIVVLVLGVVRSQTTIPPQCNPVDVVQPRNLMFLGNASSIQVGSVNFSYHQFGPLLADPATTGGTSQPNTVLLIHGFGSTQYDWPLGMLETLAQDRNVVIFDNPGIGLSVDSNPNATLSIASMANATLGLIQALNLSRPDVVGLSMGADIALTLVAKYGDQVGSVVAIAGSFGGPKAPQPVGGIGPALNGLEAIFASKYQPPSGTTNSTSNANTTSLDSSSSSNTARFLLISSSTSGTNSTSNNSTTSDPAKLFFPQGSLDPAACNLFNDYISLTYAVGFLPISGSGYAVPSIIPTQLAIVPSTEIMNAQKRAILAFHSNTSTLPALLSTSVTNQIMYMAGIQDNIIPITTQVQAANMTPGAWLLQIPEGGHGMPFLNPGNTAATITNFLDGATSLSPVEKSYYAPTSSSVSSMSSHFQFFFLPFMAMALFTINL